MIILRKFFTRIAFSLFISILLFAATGAAGAVIPTQDLLQGADAVNLKIEKHYTINIDGSYTLNIYIKRRILTYKGKKNYADFKLNYNQSRQQVKLLKAQTTTDKGDVLTVKPEEIHDIPAPWNSEVSLYSKSRQMVVSLPAVEPGSEIEVELELQSKNGFWCQENFRLNDPILDKTVTIDAPASINLHSRVPHNLKLIQQQQKTDSETIRYQWQGKNIPALTPERGAAPLAEQGFCLLISTFSDWKQVAKLFQQSFINAQDIKSDKISTIQFHNSNQNNDPISHQLYRQIRKLTTYEISFQETDWKIQSPAETRRLGYGTDCDLALLFSTQLKLRRQPASIVMINSQNHFLEKFVDFPYPGWWDTALVKNRTNFFLFSSEKAAPGITGYDGRIGLDLESGKVIKIKDRTANRITTWLQLNLMQFPHCRGELIFKLEGAEATAWRAQWRDLSDPEKEIAALQLLHQIDPEAEFTEKISITGLKNDRNRLSYKCKFKLELAGTKLTHNSPTPQYLLPVKAPELPLQLTSMLSNRLQPLTIMDNLVIVNQTIVQLPNDYTFITAPPATSGTLPGFSWQIKSKINPANNRFTYNRVINLHREIIQSQTPDYKRLINTVRSLFRPDALRVIFSVNTDADRK